MQKGMLMKNTPRHVQNCEKAPPTNGASMTRRTSYPGAPAVAALALAALALAACGSNAKAAATTVAVEGTDTACTPAVTTAAPGRIAFALTNKAKETNELYVTGADGKTKGEVENVGVGTTRTLTVSR